VSTGVIPWQNPPFEKVGNPTISSLTSQKPDGERTFEIIHDFSRKDYGRFRKALRPAECSRRVPEDGGC